MTKYLDSVTRELKHSFYTGLKKNDYYLNRLSGPNGLFNVISTGMAEGKSFRKNWVELFTVFPEQESLRCMQRIYKANGLPIPADLKPVADIL